MQQQQQQQQQDQRQEENECAAVANHPVLVSSPSVTDLSSSLLSCPPSSNGSIFRIAIIGLGPSGLSTALAIQKEWLECVDTIDKNTNFKEHEQEEGDSSFPFSTTRIRRKKNPTMNHQTKNILSSLLSSSTSCRDSRQDGTESMSSSSSYSSSSILVLDLYDKDDDGITPTCLESLHNDSLTTATQKGYGMTLTYNPQTGPLASLGILESVAQHDCPSKSHYIFTPQGHILGYYGRYFTNIHGGSTQRGSIRIPRHVLKCILYQTLIQRQYAYIHNHDTITTSKETNHYNHNKNRKHEIHFHWGKKFKSYSTTTTTTGVSTHDDHSSCATTTTTIPLPQKLDEKNHTTFTLSFEDGTMTYANMIIGADGIHSKVLQQHVSLHQQQQQLLKEKQQQREKKGSTNIQVPELHGTIEKHVETKTLSYTSHYVQSSSSYLGVMLILGITKDFYHPLLDERGFYTVDGEHRLFTMPYEGSHIQDIESFGTSNSGSNSNTVWPKSISSSSSSPSSSYHVSSLIPCQRRRRYMWQLSFRMDSLIEAITLAKQDPTAILQMVKQRLQGWHTPIEDMLQSTPVETIWGTPLYDRNPTLLLQPILQSLSLQQPVVVMGDAIHAMSPFKGQGCNQALMDGPLLTSWFKKSSSIHTALKGFTRDMIQRSSKKVHDSRQAASFYHSPSVLSQINDFSGVVSDKIPHLLTVLKERGITADCGIELDCKVAQVIQELQVMKDDCKDKKKVDGVVGIQPRQGFSLSMSISNMDPRIETALNTLCPDSSDPSRIPMYYCLLGDTGKLRELSLMDSDRIRYAVARNGMTCLHVAAKEGHYFTCRWLLSDYGLHYNLLDHNQQSPLHAAALGGNPKIIHLLTQISMFCDECWLPNNEGKTPMDIISGSHPTLIHLMMPKQNHSISRDSNPAKRSKVITTM